MGHSIDVTNPTGGANDRRDSTQPALDCDLMSRVLEGQNVLLAWKQVRRNGGAPGVDGMTISEFPAFARHQWPRIRQAVENGTYQPQPVRRKAIPKPNGGGVRMLGIPTVLDRVLQQAIAQVLTPIFDPEFSGSSFGFRPQRSAQGAVKQIQRFIRAGFRTAVDLDLTKFFDRVDFDVLMSRVGRRIHDRKLLRLIGLYLRAGVMIEGELSPTTQGVPQGGPLSPLLANIILDDLDKELERRGHRFARYADDITIVVGSKRSGERVMASVTRWLDRVLHLEVNAQKSRVVPTNQTNFLGFTFRGTKICWSGKTLQRLKARIRELTGRNWGVSMERRMRELRLYLRGWMGYFGLSAYYRPVPGLESWIRRRVRMCYWVMWRKRYTRIQRLIALGVAKKWAILTGLSSKGPWHMARNYAIHVGLSDTYLAQNGLVSFRDLWIQSAPLR